MSVRIVAIPPYINLHKLNPTVFKVMTNLKFDINKEAQTLKEEGRIIESAEEAVLLNISNTSWTTYARVGMAALSALDWVGSLVGVASSLSAEVDQNLSSKLMYYWVKEHELKLAVLSNTINNIFLRFDSFGERIMERIESEEYLSLVRKTFQVWDRAETMEKREMLRRLITNAGGITINQDDWVRMYIDWIDKYHEFHFHVINEINKQPNISRRQIWLNLRGSLPREDSSEADLFKLLIRDLSTGGVIRQGRKSSSSEVSAFDANAGYVLTELGKQFVHYVMTETSPLLDGSVVSDN